MPCAELYYEKMIRMGMREVHYDAMLEYDPENINAFERHLLGCAFIQGNILIAKRQIYREYVDYLFGYFEALKSVIQNEGEELKPRFLAYASEHVTNTFFRIHADDYKIGWVKANANYQ